MRRSVNTKYNEANPVILVSHETIKLFNYYCSFTKTRPGEARRYIIERTYAISLTSNEVLVHLMNMCYTTGTKTKQMRIPSDVKQMLEGRAYQTGIGMGVLFSYALFYQTQMLLPILPNVMITSLLTLSYEILRRPEHA